MKKTFTICAGVLHDLQKCGTNILKTILHEDVEISSC